MVNKPEEYRYYLIACGTSDYDFIEDAQLNSVRDDIEQVVEVLTGQFGYEEALTHLRHNPDKETLKIEFAKWLSHESRTENDRVIFYYSGHGHYCTNDRHYLLMKSTQQEIIQQTSLTTISLVKPLNRDSVKIKQVLYIIDTCYAEAGAIDLISFIINIINRQQNINKERKTIGCIAGCRVKQLSNESLFAITFNKVLTSWPLEDNSLYIPPVEIIDRMNNEILSIQRINNNFSIQRVNYSCPGAEEVAKFFPKSERVYLIWKRARKHLIPKLYKILETQHIQGLHIINLFLLATYRIYKLKFLLHEDDIFECLKVLSDLRTTPDGICPLLASSEWFRKIFSDNKMIEATNAISEWQKEVIKVRSGADLYRIRDFVLKLFDNLKREINENESRIQIVVEPERNKNGNGLSTNLFILSVKLWIKNKKYPLADFTNKFQSDDYQDNIQQNKFLLNALQNVLPNIVKKTLCGLSFVEINDLDVEVFLPFDDFNLPIEEICFPDDKNMEFIGKKNRIFINSYERYFDADFLEIRSQIQLKKNILWEINDYENSRRLLPEEFSFEKLYVGTTPPASKLEEVEELLPIAIWSRNETKPLERNEFISDWQEWPKKVLEKRNENHEITLFWDDLFPKPSKYIKPLNTGVVYQ